MIQRIFLSTLLLMSGLLTSHAFAADLQILSYHVQPIPKKTGENGIDLVVKAQLSDVPFPSPDESFLFTACLNLPLHSHSGFDSARCFSTFETMRKNVLGKNEENYF